MSGHDKLTDLYAPNLVSRFDEIPAEHPLGSPVTKGELAMLIKSTWQMHQAMNSLVQAVNNLIYADELRAPLTSAYQSLQASGQSLNVAVTELITRAVRDWEGRR